MYKLSKLALLDLEKLYRYTLTQFGKQQATNYFEGLMRTLELMAEFPDMGHSVAHIRPNLLAHTHQSHTIYYRKQSDHIFIVRVLHNKMDHKRYM